MPEVARLRRAPLVDPRRARAPVNRSWFATAASVACLAATLALAPATARRASTEAEQGGWRLEAPLDLAGADRTRLALSRDTPPARDEVALARQFRGRCTDPMPTPVPAWHPGTVGERRTFKVLDERRRVFLDARTVLRGATAHLLVYVQEGLDIPPGAIEASTDRFENVTLPVLEETFGPLPSPGRITIFVGHVPGVGGYFSSSDLVPASLSPHSNERAMIYMNSDVTRPGQDGFDGIVAHEVQHYLHWLRHPQQDSWLNEGASEMAMHLTGHALAAPIRAYVRKIETPVTGWAERPGAAVPHYGAAALVVRYLAFRAGGPDRLRAIIQTPGVSTQVVDRYLSVPTADLPRGIPPRPSSFDDLFGDFIVATLLDDPRVADGRYAFGPDPTLADKPSAPERIVVDIGNAETREGTLRPYGTRVVEFAARAGADLELTVEGGAMTRAIPADVPGGATVWWAYPADEVDATLTRTLDLRGDASPATLEFDAWHDLEADYDYAGVALSVDGGCSWRTVAGTGTTDANPVGQNPGQALTGRSGGGDEARWVPMRFDLAEATGTLATVRLFQVTDQAFHGAGLAVANVRVRTSAGTIEGPTGATFDPWEVRGFIETGNRVAVEWAARAVVARPAGTRVEAIPVRRGTDGRATGTLTVPGSERGAAPVTVLVAPMAPGTQQPVDFRVTAVAR